MTMKRQWSRQPQTVDTPLTTAPAPPALNPTVPDPDPSNRVTDCGERHRGMSVCLVPVP